MPAPTRRRPSRPELFAIAVCGLLLATFAAVSYRAASTHCATFDEPVHLMAARAALHARDFSIDPDHPPLWKYLAALPLPPADNLASPAYRHIPTQLETQWGYAVDTLYRTPGPDPVRLLARSRLLMLLLGVALGATIAAFAWQLAGPLAAVAAAALFCLDPNFLAHASLTKNDVPLTLCLTAIAFALWRASQRLTALNVATIALLCAAAVTTKLTGLLAGPIVALTLLARALSPHPWPVLSRTLATRARRLAAALAICLTCTLTTYVSIWAVYGFRFAPTPDPAVHFNVPAAVAKAAHAETSARVLASGRTRVERADLEAWTPGPFLSATLFALDHRLLPEPFLFGATYSYAWRFRSAYLLGDVYAGAKWYYFPVAFLVKTPLATLVALALPAALLLTRRRTPSPLPTSPFPTSLPHLLPLLIPTSLLILFALTADLNIGLRHIFPLYPLLFILTGLSIARLYSLRPKLTRPLLLLLGLTLATETALSFPNYIPFFNATAGGYRGGFHILGDSNLDWGQDLPLLAKWQRDNPTRTLHLAYFGSADPAYYGIRYRNAPDGYPFAHDPPAATLPTSGVLAVSASILQGLTSADPARSTYAPFRHRAPTEILGGSLYLFDLDKPAK